MNKLLEITALTGMMANVGGFDYSTGRYSGSYSDTPCKTLNKIKGYGEPTFSKSKKLRKGAGHRKLTRAERKLCK